MACHTCFFTFLSNLKTGKHATVNLICSENLLRLSSRTPKFLHYAPSRRKNTCKKNFKIERKCKNKLTHFKTLLLSLYFLIRLFNYLPKVALQKTSNNKEKGKAANNEKVNSIFGEKKNVIGREEKKVERGKFFQQMIYQKQSWQTSLQEGLTIKLFSIFQTLFNHFAYIKEKQCKRRTHYRYTDSLVMP